MYVPGKYLGRLAKSLVGKGEVTRRDFVLGGLEVLGLGAVGGTTSLLTRESGLDFDYALRTVKERYPVGAYRKLGPNLVFYLEDVHIPKVKSENISRINFLEDKFDLPLVGLEGYAGKDEDSEINKEAMERINKIMKIDPRKVFIRPGTEGAYVIRPRASVDFKQLRKNDQFKSLGLERESVDELIKLGLSIEAGRIYEMFIEGLQLGGFIGVELRGRPTPHPYLLGRIQEYFKDDPEFPKFDIKRIKESRDAPTRVLYNENGADHIIELIRAYSNWFEKNLNHPRTVSAANRLMDEMETNRFDRAAVIFGKLHGDVSSETSFQNEFEKRGFSYITLRI